MICEAHSRGMVDEAGCVWCALVEAREKLAKAIECLRGLERDEQGRQYVAGACLDEIDPDRSTKRHLFVRDASSTPDRPWCHDCGFGPEYWFHNG